MDTWIQTYHCFSRSHCDYCLDNAEWHMLLTERFTMPEQGTCPYGETLVEAKARRVDVLAARVEAGTVSLADALITAAALGMDLDGALDEPTTAT